MSAEELLKNLEEVAVAVKTGAVLKFSYVNYKGEHSIRTARFRKLDFVTSPWHPERQWIADGIDAGKGQERSFAVASIKFDQGE